MNERAIILLLVHQLVCRNTIPSNESHRSQQGKIYRKSTRDKLPLRNARGICLPFLALHLYLEISRKYEQKTGCMSSESMRHPLEDIYIWEWSICSLSLSISLWCNLADYSEYVTVHGCVCSFCLILFPSLAWLAVTVATDELIRSIAPVCHSSSHIYTSVIPCQIIVCSCPGISLFAQCLFQLFSVLLSSFWITCCLLCSWISLWLYQSAVCFSSPLQFALCCQSLLPRHRFSTMSDHSVFCSLGLFYF